MDQTENVRRTLVNEINSEEAGREEMEAKYGQVWNTAEVFKDFEIHGFMAPFVTATKRSTGERGSLMFQHSPRFYFAFNVTS